MGSAYSTLGNDLLSQYNSEQQQNQRLNPTSTSNVDIVELLKQKILEEGARQRDLYEVNKQTSLDQQSLFRNEANARAGKRAFLQQLDFGTGVPHKVSSYNKPLFEDPRKTSSGEIKPIQNTMKKAREPKKTKGYNSTVDYGNTYSPPPAVEKTGQDALNPGVLLDNTRYGGWRY